MSFCLKRLVKVAKLPKKTETETETAEEKPETAEEKTETAEVKTETAEAKREKTYATIPQSEVAKALVNKTNREQFAKWLEEQANNGLQYVYIELNK